jgi:hypothetical protein
MLIAAIVIYVIAALLAGPLWPLQLISGKAGILGVLLVIGWLVLLVKGMA